MRIIGGKMRGTKLQTLDGFETTRPTLDRVKESLFNIISMKIIDSEVLDLFSGSGALGIEAISRGARKAYLCDMSLKAINVIKQNVEKTRCKDFVFVLNKKHIQALEFFKQSNKKFDIVFLDPPYETDLAEKSTEYIITNNLLNDEGIIIIETDDEERTIKGLNVENVEIYDTRRYGRVSLIFLKRKG